MNNQGWPDERCAKCGLRAKLNMGCKGDGPLYIRLRPCGRCGEVRYCNRECQRAHWKMHKKVCVVPGDKPPPPMDPDLRAAVAAQIEKRGVYILAHASAARPGQKLGPDDMIHVHTIGFFEHGMPELCVPRLPHKLLQRAGGLLSYVRNVRPLDQRLKDGEPITVNGLTFTAQLVTGPQLEEANFGAVSAVRAFYELKKSAPLAQLVELTLVEDGGLDEESQAKLDAHKPKKDDPTLQAELRAADRMAANLAIQDARAAAVA
eukprot:CAMPEP_0119297042 /NCGR_PEP_ID=MMETSP1329-20130426/50877_1 /TAXON_ID=114041 /ORGANISM="Genus nov. species nov., Strain RCC1024" /LENGTH=261 /DNA_ID=CAMNT_0007297983 /DNA_START=179 /DNA_END=960 /DNA_ORIENTATION=+